jgi:hypothetical protein
MTVYKFSKITKNSGMVKYVFSYITSQTLCV